MIVFFICLTFFPEGKINYYSLGRSPGLLCVFAFPKKFSGADKNNTFRIKLTVAGTA